MAFTFSGGEVFDMLVMTFAAGFIFMDMFRREAAADPVEQWTKRERWTRRFGYSALLVAVPILLHELAHKFIASAYGLTATFHAAYFWLGLGVVIKLISFPFLFMVPAYVSIQGAATPLQHSLIAFAGPAVHLIIFVVSWFVLKRKGLSADAARFWQYTKLINGFLFVFNMIPIPGFDGSKVFLGLWQAFF